MKLAFVTPRFSPSGVVGGAETLIRQLAEHAAAAGHEVHLLATCALDHFTWANARPPGRETVNGMTVHYCPVNEDRDLSVFLGVQGRIDRRQPVSLADQERWAANSVCSRTLVEFLEREGKEFDAILVGPYLFGITFQVARLHPERTWLIPCLHDEPFAALDIVKHMFLSVRGHLFNALPEKQLAERLYGLPPDRGHVVGMGMTPFEADPKAFAARHGITRPYVLYCGRREAGKNTPLLLDYLDAYKKRRRPDLLLVLAGSGEYVAPESLRADILDVGFVSETEKREAMAGASVFLHPSTNESFGIVLLEAWLARVPALVHARSEVLRWQCESANAGLWFAYYPEFEAMLDLLLDQPDLARRMGARGRRFVETEYTWDAVGQRLFRALKGSE
jgi:glycosyltransferase involved in cell wall biosynthesis